VWWLREAHNNLWRHGVLAVSGASPDYFHSACEHNSSCVHTYQVTARSERGRVEIDAVCASGSVIVQQRGAHSAEQVYALDAHMRGFLDASEAVQCFLP